MSVYHPIELPIDAHPEKRGSSFRPEMSDRRLVVERRGEEATQDRTGDRRFRQWLVESERCVAVSKVTKRRAASRFESSRVRACVSVGKRGRPGLAGRSFPIRWLSCGEGEQE